MDLSALFGNQQQTQMQSQSPYSRLMEDPLFAIGYGLLTSRENPIGEATKIMSMGEQSRQSRLEMEQKQAQQQRLQEQMQMILGGGSNAANPDSLAQAGVLLGNPQLMQYATMLDSRKKLTKDQWGRPVVMDISQPDAMGSAAQPMQRQAMPSGGTNYVDESGAMPQQQALDEMASLGIPNSPQGWSSYTAYKKNQREQLAQKTAEQSKEKGLKNFDAILSQLYADLDELSANNLVPSEDASVIDNILNYISGTEAGQEYQKAIGSRKSTLEETSKSMRLRLMQAVMQATGMSSKQIDSNAELKAMLDSFGSPTATAQARRAILDNIHQSFGAGSIASNSTTSPDLSTMSTQDLERMLQEME